MQESIIGYCQYWIYGQYTIKILFKDNVPRDFADNGFLPLQKFNNFPDLWPRKSLVCIALASTTTSALRYGTIGTMLVSINRNITVQFNPSESQNETLDFMVSEESFATYRRL